MHKGLTFPFSSKERSTERDVFLFPRMWYVGGGAGGVGVGESKKSSGAPVDRPQTWMPVKDVREMIVRCPLESERFRESLQSLHQHNPATQPVREIYKGKENLLCTYMCIHMFTHTRRSFKFS